jgi:radical SAM superfamily enzyme YgiQ (UPF0313 family)
LAYKRIMLIRPRSRCGWGFMFPPLALNLEYIAASMLDDVDEVKIVNQEFDESPIEGHLKDFTPDLLGVTMSATEHNSGLEQCRRAKKAVKGLRTVVGGFHASVNPKLMLSHKEVDMVGIGEAEITMRELVKAGSPVDIDGIVYKDKKGKLVHNPRRPVVEDLDELPFPARHLRAGNECDYSVKNHGVHRDQIHSSRGCWGKCTFCCEPHMSGSRQRYRRPEKFMEELREIWDLHGHNPIWILIGDPHFMGRPKNSERIAEMLIDADLDINFTAMVRADMIAKHPKIVEKMVLGGIVGYCMGMESPAQDDLGDTRKGISTKVQREAVRILRKNHAVAGGTFVGGLPGHTEKEILMFPEYARNLGMINAAFPVATPHSGTQFYKDLDAKGLIDDRNWSNYDQMHLVFKHETLTRKRCEEILTHCLGRFYALDIFLDDIIATQHRDEKARKVTLYGGIKHFLDRMNFVLEAGSEYETIEDGAKMGKVFLEAQVNPHTKRRTKAIGIHNIVDLRTFLSVLGRQEIRMSLRYGGKTFANYVMKVEKDRVSFLDINDGPESKDTTIGIALDLEDVSTLKKDKTGFILKMAKRLFKMSKLSSLFRTAFAFAADRLKHGGSKTSDVKMELPEGFFDHFCGSDDWDPEKYARLRSRS